MTIQDFCSQKGFNQTNSFAAEKMFTKLGDLTEKEWYEKMKGKFVVPIKLEEQPKKSKKDKNNDKTE